MKSQITDWILIEPLTAPIKAEAVNEALWEMSNKINKTLEHMGAKVRLDWRNPEWPENIKRNAGFFLVSITE